MTRDPRVGEQIAEGIHPDSVVHSSALVHPSSIVDDRVQIGADSRVWHFCHVLSGTVIGAGCSFGQSCMIGPDVRVGDGVRVQNNVSIYQGVTLEDDVFVGPSAVFTNVRNPRAFISRKRMLDTTRVRRGATIGANATIVCGVTIGRYAFIGAGATVTRDVPDHALMLGVPARHVGWVSTRGNRLSFGDDGCAADPEDGSRYELVDGDNGEQRLLAL